MKDSNEIEVTEIKTKVPKEQKASDRQNNEPYSLLKPKEPMSVRLEKYKKMSTGGGANNLHIRNPDPDYHYRFEAVKVNGESIPGIEAHLAAMGVESVDEEEALRVGAPGREIGGLLLCKRHKSFVKEEYRKQKAIQSEVLAEIPQHSQSGGNPNKINFEKNIHSDSISCFPDD